MLKDIVSGRGAASATEDVIGVEDSNVEGPRSVEDRRLVGPFKGWLRDMRRELLAL